MLKEYVGGPCEMQFEDTDRLASRASTHAHRCTHTHTHTHTDTHTYTRRMTLYCNLKI